MDEIVTTERYDVCPKCGHDWFYQEDMVHDDDSLYIWYSCSKCSQAWMESYKFVDTLIPYHEEE